MHHPTDIPPPTEHFSPPPTNAAVHGGGGAAKYLGLWGLISSFAFSSCSGDKFRMVLATSLREDGGVDDEEYDPTDTGNERNVTQRKSPQA